MKIYNKKENISYAIGVYPTLELLQNKPKETIRVLLSQKGNRNEGVTKILNLCLKYNIKTEYADGLINKLSESENCYAIGVFSKYDSFLDGGNHLVLVNPSDKGNLGTIIRTMCAFDVPNLAIIKPAVDVFDPKTVRASMGELFKIKFQYFSTISDYTSVFVRNYYIFTTNGKNVLSDLKFKSPFSMVFGNEGSGLPSSYNTLGQTVKIPQSHLVDSLNLSVAVGISLYSSKI